MRYFTAGLFIFISFFSPLFCQSVKERVDYYEKEIKPYLTTDYQKAKANYISYKNNDKELYSTDYLNFIVAILNNADTSFFKKIGVDLFKKYHLFYTLSDTLETWNRAINRINPYIKKYHLQDWMAEQSQLYYFEWAKNNPDAFKISVEIQTMFKEDQFIRSNSVSFSNNADRSHFVKIVQLCGLNKGFFINDEDNGLYAYDGALLIFLHFFRTVETYEQSEILWGMVFPYIENAYKAEKINNFVFETYDFVLNEKYGFQTYGTLGKKVPLKEPEKLEEYIKRFDIVYE